MANIDDKVVSMSFEGSKFESGVRTTLSAAETSSSRLCPFPMLVRASIRSTGRLKKLTWDSLPRAIEIRKECS
jgi:hypothetical protein